MGEDRSRHDTLVTGLVVVGAIAVVVGSIMPAYRAWVPSGPQLRFVGSNEYSIVSRGGGLAWTYGLAMAVYRWAPAAVALCALFFLRSSTERARQLARGAIAAAGVVAALGALSWVLLMTSSHNSWLFGSVVFIAGNLALLLAGILALTRREPRSNAGVADQPEVERS